MSCIADRVDSSSSVSFSTQRYFPRDWQGVEEREKRGRKEERERTGEGKEKGG